MIKAVIFDLDGVIVKTDDLHYLAWQKMANKEGIHFNRTINNRLRGVSRMSSLDIILEQTKKVYTEDEKVKLATYKNDEYVRLLQSLDEKAILPNVMNVLDELKKRGIKIAIGSSSKNTPIILKQIGLDHTFDGVADGNDITHSKPDPEVFLKAAEKIGVAPKDCMVIEDAIAGIKAAKAAHMIAFAVGDAKNAKIADYQSDDLREILQITNATKKG